MKRILLTGTSGQLGWELRRTLAAQGELICPTRHELNLERPETVAAYVQGVKPDVIVNPAAYTAVDKAESEPALANAVNRDAVAELARACKQLNALLLHYSTDYVFDGSKPQAYEVTDATGPKGVYGASKLAGEEAVRNSGCRHVVARTAWVYGGRGKNFLLTMLKLSQQRDSLRVVGDQFGAPTWVRLIAEASAQLLAALPKGAAPPAALVHLTNAGSTSWHGFASAIVEQGAALGLCKNVPMHAITTADYPTPAKRPAQSALSLDVLRDTYGIHMPDWRVALTLCLQDLAAARG